MLQTIESINNVVNNFIWGVPAMICIIGVGLYLSLRTGFVQIRKFPYALKTTLGRIFKKKEASDGSMTPFQAVCTALAGTVGTGNIAGVAGAIAIGIRALYSGCGFPRSLECARNLQRLPWQFISVRETDMEIM